MPLVKAQVGSDLYIFLWCGIQLIVEHRVRAGLLLRLRMQCFFDHSQILLGVGGEASLISRCFPSCRLLLFEH